MSASKNTPLSWASHNGCGFLPSSSLNRPAASSECQRFQTVTVFDRRIFNIFKNTQQLKGDSERHHTTSGPFEVVTLGDINDTTTHPKGGRKEALCLFFISLFSGKWLLFFFLWRNIKTFGSVRGKNNTGRIPREHLCESVSESVSLRRKKQSYYGEGRGQWCTGGIYSVQCEKEPKQR